MRKTRHLISVWAALLLLGTPLLSASARADGATAEVVFRIAVRGTISAGTPLPEIAVVEAPAAVSSSVTALALTTSAIVGLAAGDLLASVALSDDVLAEGSATGTRLVKRAFDSSETPYVVISSEAHERQESGFTLIGLAKSVFTDSADKRTESYVAFPTEQDARAYYESRTGSAR